MAKAKCAGPVLTCPGTSPPEPSEWMVGHTALKQQQDRSLAGIERHDALGGASSARARAGLCRIRRAGEVVAIDGGLQHPARLQHQNSPSFKIDSASDSNMGPTISTWRPARREHVAGAGDQHLRRKSRQLMQPIAAQAEHEPADAAPENRAGAHRARLGARIERRCREHVGREVPAPRGAADSSRRARESAHR